MKYMIWLIARQDLKKVLHGRFYLWALFIIVFGAFYFDNLKSTISALMEQGASIDQMQAACRSFLGALTFTLPVIMATFICSVFSNSSVVVDKNKRLFEPMLATPLSLAQVWLGKSLAVALPGLIAGITGTLLIAVILNVVFIIPAVGSFILPGAIPLLGAFVIMPVLVSLAVLMITAMELIMVEPVIPSLIFTVISLGIYMTALFQISKNWDFSIVYLAIISVSAVGTFCLGRILSKERVILSSRG